MCRWGLRGGVLLRRRVREPVLRGPRRRRRSVCSGAVLLTAGAPGGGVLRHAANPSPFAVLLLLDPRNRVLTSAATRHPFGLASVGLTASVDLFRPLDMPDRCQAGRRISWRSSANAHHVRERVRYEPPKKLGETPLTMPGSGTKPLLVNTSLLIRRYPCGQDCPKGRREVVA